MKDVKRFISDILKLRSINEIDKEIRLHLHNYFDCEMTMVLHVLNPYNLENNSFIEGLTTHSSKLCLNFGQLDAKLQHVIKEKKIYQEGGSN